MSKTPLKGLSKTIDNGADKQWEAYRTDPKLFAWLNSIFAFTIDVAADHANHLCRRYYTKRDNGLEMDWRYEVVWCNPPFNQIGDFMAKMVQDNATGVVLCIGSSITREYFIRFPPSYTLSIGAIQFISPATMEFVQTPYPTGCFFSIFGNLDSNQTNKLKKRGVLLRVC